MNVTITKKKNKKTTKRNQKLKNMQKHLPLVFELVLKLRTSTYTWQGQGKYHIMQVKQKQQQ
jgi:hypothetical protein